MPRGKVKGSNSRVVKRSDPQAFVNKGSRYDGRGGIVSTGSVDARSRRVSRRSDVSPSRKSGGNKTWPAGGRVARPKPRVDKDRRGGKAATGVVAALTVMAALSGKQQSRASSSQVGRRSVVDVDHFPSRDVDSRLFDVSEPSSALDIASDVSGDLYDGVSSALSSVDSVLTRFGEMIPSPIPVAAAAEARAGLREVKDKKQTAEGDVKKRDEDMSFDEFFDEYARDKVKVIRRGRKLKSKSKTAKKMIGEFRDMCKLAVDNGNDQLVNYFLKHIEGIDIEVESFATSDYGVVVENALASYISKSAHIMFYARHGSLKNFVAEFLHEATHFVQDATRSSRSQSFMEECSKKMKLFSDKIENCIVDHEDCSDLRGYLKMADYRGGCVQISLQDLNQDKLMMVAYEDKERSGELTDLVYKMHKVGPSLYKLKLRYTLDKSNNPVPVSKEDKILFDMLLNIMKNSLAYERLIDPVKDKAVSDEVFQRGKEDFITFITENEKKKRGVESSYSEAELREIKNRVARLDIDSRITYLFYIFSEKEAYTVSAADSRIVEDICGEPEFEWLDKEMARIYEIERAPFVITSDALERLESMGIECHSRVIPPYPGRVFDPKKENKFLSSALLDRPEARMRPKSSSDRLAGSRDGRDL